MVFRWVGVFVLCHRFTSLDVFQQRHEVPGDVAVPEGPPTALPSILAANSSASETGGEALGVSGDCIFVKIQQSRS